MESNVEIFIENEKGKSFLVDCPKEIKYSQLQKIIKDKNITELTNYYYILLNGATYDDNNLNEILKLEEGDKLIIVNERSDENGYFIEFHKNYNLNENDMKTEPLTGLLRLMLVKYISSFISDTSNINSQEIKKIISDLRIGLKEKENTKEDIKANLEETQGNNILVYSNYINSIISDKIINQLLLLLPKNKQNEVKKQWSLLSKYQDFSKLFEEELFKAIEKSYFDYSLIGLSLYEQKNRRIFIESMNTCPNLVVKYLFHGTQLDPIKEILTDGFLYTRKAFYGMGIYFSDMLDYVAFYAGGKDFKTRREYFGKVIPVNSVFSCVSAEIYYSQSKKKDIYDFNLLVKTLDHFPTYEEIKRDYPDKMVEKDGIHFARVEPYQGRVRKREQIIDDAKKGKFIGNEYVITEFQQILPLYGLTFRRNEFFVVWRDNHFKGNNEYSKFLKERKLFIYEYAKMNAYFEDSLEKALEIIKRKKYNKIILISNIGLDKAGKKFVEVARKLLGFNVVVLFFSGNSSHFSWLQNFPNALYTNNSSFYKDFILNYNEKGLLDLKKKIENQYKIKLKFTNDYMKFPNFIDSDKYDNIIFGGPSPNFKKVIISNSYNKVILCMNSDSEPCFKSVDNSDVNSYIWYITLMDNEITLYSNGNYLGVNTNSKKATREEFMKTFKFEKIGKNDYIIYFDDKNNVLTVSGSNAIIQKESYNNSNQKFRLVEEIENA
jgi:hypothetical protein